MSGTLYSPPNKKTHFLVSGGGKGITAANVIELANTYHSRFTLIGRSELMKLEPEWSTNLEDESALKKAALDYFKKTDQKLTPKEIGQVVGKILSSREIYQTIQQINLAGGSAEYFQVDITNSTDLENKIKGVIPVINGLIHGAGALADKFIEDKTEADFDLVYGVKINGLQNILNLIPASQLNYLILFSSVAGFYGNAGQTDYSLSNEILNKFAHHFKSSYPACQVLSIGWGPWDGGMVTPQLRRIFTKMNIPMISLEDGTRALADLLATHQSNPQRVIGNPLPFPPRKITGELKEYRILRQLSLEANPFLGDHVIGGNAVLPTVCAVAWFINSCEALYPDYKFYSIKDYRVFKGIVFDSSSPPEYLLDLKELKKSPDGLVFEGKISSETSQGKSRFHYQVQVELRKQIPERPRISDFSLKKDSPLPGKSLYDSKVLFHGPMFQGVRQILNISPAGLTTECQLDDISAIDMGQFPVHSFNPYQSDVHLQSLLIWAHSQQQSIGLPLQIAGAVQYELVPFGMQTYATMRVKSTTPHKLVADVISHDQDGYIYSEVMDAEITLNEKLYDLFSQNQLEKQPVWI